MNVASVLAALLLSFMTSLVLTPLVRTWAARKGVVDQPGGRRVHTQVTPRLGGVSVILGFFAPLVLFALLETEAMQSVLYERQLVVGLLAGSLIVGLVGAIDDVRGLGPWTKLAAQAAAASVGYAAGYRIQTVNLPFVGDLDMGIMGPAVTMLWFLAITNAINLIDGLDGLAAGIALCAAVSNLFIAFLNGSFIVVLLSAGLTGSLLGFLRYNFNPATIFLGDAGSMFLGFVLAATSIAGSATKSSTAIAILAPIIALGIPILDTMLAMIRRTLAGQSMFAADRGHIHHRLLDLGLTHRRVVLTLYGTSIFLAGSAIIITFGRSWQLGGALVLAGLVIFTLVRSVNHAHKISQAASSADQTVLAEAVAVLGQRARDAVLALEGCDDYASIERCLAELGSDKRLIAKVEWGDAHQAVPRPEALARGELVYELGSRSYVLEFDLSATLRPAAAELYDVLATVANACERAFARVLAQGSERDMLPAQ